MQTVISGPRTLRGETRIPGDKSISHRAVLLGAVARGNSRIQNLSTAADVRSSIEAVRSLGITVSLTGDQAEIQGRGFSGLGRNPGAPGEVPAAIGDVVGAHRGSSGADTDSGSSGPIIDCGNSGTTARMLLGLLCGAGIRATLTGDPSLRSRPMERVAGPLREAGADIRCTEGRLPCTILSRPAGGFSYTLPVASAQVKSALLMAGLFGPETWRVTEPVPSRDHTERMLSDMGAAIERKGDTWVLTGGRELRPLHLTVPGDVSSAVFLLCAALVCPGSRVTVRDVLLNPTRAAIVDVLGEMGADIQVRRTEDLPEPRGDLTARHSSLRGVRIGGRRIPLLIDELPALAAAGMFAEGDTVVRDAAELRVKESDRIRSVVHMVHSFGGRAEELEDGFVVHGAAGERARLHPADADSRGDHRIAMAAAVAACAVRGDSRIEGAEAASVSYPEFYSVLENLASGSG